MADELELPPPKRLKPRPPTADENASALIARVHPVLLAILSVLGVCAVLGGFAVYLLNTAAAQTAQQNLPVEKRLTFVEAQLPFVVVEVRSIREEQRAAAEERRTGGVSPLLTRPMAPLPIPDAGADGGVP